MAYDPKVAARVTADGELIVADAQLWRALIERNKGRDVTLTIKRKVLGRTLPQLGYYWAVVIQSIADEIGDDPDAVHVEMKHKFLPRVSKTSKKGVVFERAESTSELDVEHFTTYVEDIRHWAASFLNLNIPDPTRVEARI